MPKFMNGHTMPQVFQNMKSVFKKQKGKTSGFGAGPDANLNVDDQMYGELRGVWPDGTWNLKVNSQEYNPLEYDGIVRYWLLRVWSREDFQKQQAAWAGRLLNPAMVTPRRIPKGWKPSRKAVESLAEAERLQL